MGPKKGAKRKSESPPTVLGDEVERKKYITRSSNRKRVSYTETSNEDEINEPPVKVVCSSSDDDFMVVDNEKDDDKQHQTNRRLSLVTANHNKKNSKPSTSLKKGSRTKSNEAITSCQPMITTFKPVNIDASKIKSELNLSDESDSEDSCSDDKSLREFKSSPKGKISSCFPNNCDDQKQWTEHTTVKAEIEAEAENIALNPWMKNLEALKDENNHGTVHLKEEAPLKTEKRKSTPKKGKKVKQSAKKTPKNVSSSSGLQEISVAEMLKLEENQDSSSEDGDDADWEKVKPIVSSVDNQEQEKELPKSVEVTLDVSGLKRKKKGTDIKDLIRLRINRIRREIQLVNV